MRAALDQPTADPGRLHADALRVRATIEHHRDEVAQLLGTRNRSVIFTSGATESITAAVWGAAERCDRVAYAMVEHSAVRAASERWFPADGVTVLPVDGNGRIGPDAIAPAVAGGPALIHVQWVNHEVGTIQPVAEIVAAARAGGALVHVDAAQAVGRIPIDFDELGADLLSASAHKLGGPAGLGVLVVRRGLRLPPLLQGGAQERNRRAGLENIPAIAGLGAVAAALDRSRLEYERRQVTALSRRLHSGLARLPEVRVHGDPDHALPHIISVGIEGVEPQAVLLGLDRAGVAAHSGSACAGEDLEPSPVLRAMGLEADRSLRLSLGWSSTDADVDAVLDALPDVLEHLRRLR
jgi:cysteine desulfurase